MSVLNKLSSKHNADLLSSIRMSFESAQADMLMEQREVEQLNNELQKTIQVKDAVELVSNSMDPNDANYGVAMEAIFVAAGLTLPSELLVPSFEAEDKKADADEKKKGFVKRAWEAIKAFFKKLYDGFMRLIGRKKKVAEAMKEAAEDLAKGKPKAEGGKEGEYQSKDEPEAPSSANGNATMAGTSSKEFAANAPRIMKEFAVGYMEMIEIMGKDAINLEEAVITDPTELLSRTGLGKAGVVVKGTHGKDFSAKFVVRGDKIASEVSNPSGFQAVKYEPLSEAEAKKLGEEMLVHINMHMKVYADFDQIKKAFDKLIGFIDEAMKAGDIKAPEKQKAAELAVSLFRSITTIYSSDSITPIGQALSIIRNISVGKPTTGTVHNGQRALTHSPA